LGNRQQKGHWKGYDVQIKNNSELDKATLERLYLKEDKSTHEIARVLGCSSETIANRCRTYGIKLKRQGRKRKEIDKETLKRLYVTEGKDLKEINKILGCSYNKVWKSCLDYGIRLRTAHK
jgi:DNA-binding CsgD family transcriptional regulator